MITQRKSSSLFTLIASAGLGGTLLVAPGLAGGTPAGLDPCDETSLALSRACQRNAVGDFWTTRAECANLPSASARNACVNAAFSAMEEELDLCGEQFLSRSSVCSLMGGGIYHPKIDKMNFVSEVTNSYFPLVPGMTYIYEKVTPEETERIELTITHDTKEIEGLTAIVVRDVALVDGVLLEDTFDWYAQDKDDNVWYLGEISQNFDDGELTDLGGSWKTRVDGAKPGIIMLGNPQVGDFYRQEFLVGEAEDVAGVLSTNAFVSVPYGDFSQCLQTEDYTPLEPGHLEHKFYAPGIGLVLEVDTETGDRLELIDIIFP